MKRIVLIDGENLTYGLRQLLGTDESRADRSVIETFNYRGLIEDILQDQPPDEIIWLGAQLRVYNMSEEIKLKSETAVRQQSIFFNLINKQRIIFSKVGYMHAREVECDEGHTHWKLVEKGVDVGLAVEMVSMASQDIELVVISADTDLIPAFKVARLKGSKILHVGYESRPIVSLSHLSDATRLITVPLAQKYV